MTDHTDFNDFDLGELACAYRDAVIASHAAQAALNDAYERERQTSKAYRDYVAAYAVSELVLEAP